MYARWPLARPPQSRAGKELLHPLLLSLPLLPLPFKL